jgi:DnaJ domain
MERHIAVPGHWAVAPVQEITSRGSPRWAGGVPNFYRSLGLRPGADARLVKAAYRSLVKRFHPDIHAGKAVAEQRIKEINHAYQTLGHPARRAAYDVALLRQRAAARWRCWKSAAAGLASFILTTSAVILVALPILHPRPRGGLPQVDSTQLASLHGVVQGSHVSAQPLTPPWQRIPQEEFETDLPPQTAPAHGEHSRTAENLQPPKTRNGQSLLATVFMAPAPTRDKPTKWVPYHSARLGFGLKYPADVFTTAVQGDFEGNERFLLSEDGRALLWIAAMHNGAAQTIADYRQSLMTGRYADASFDYTPQRSHWFVLSGTVGQEMFYERVTFACDHRTIHRWLLLYPLAERAYFDAIIEEIHRSYRYDLGTRAHCGGSQPDPAGARTTPE